ncbi:hypothetical protein [Bradyrhizobium canariense]|uniref:Uncharacterized protein n=1 Tax=Bradyrhizobium canariense TaxID=255045 RepID=A0A1H1W292_9BRAD|nr:hypothetical protein [Bradyrhizobium canariense]SDS90781.1 hypothetical protein SAMN05444158_3641 [Bradyrhizobium canariense]
MPDRWSPGGILTRLISAVQRLLGGRYQVTPMLARFAGEEIPGNRIWAGNAVRYLTPAERASYALTLRDGRICDAAGKPFDTRGSESLFSDNRAIFVMDADGNFFASKDQKIGEFHPSSLAAGGPVAAAGELEVIGGVLKALSDKSGHYTPARRFTVQAIDRLKKNRISCQWVTLDLTSRK